MRYTIGLLLLQIVTALSFSVGPKSFRPETSLLMAAKGFGSSKAPPRQTGYTGAKALRKSANQYDALRKEHGVEYSRDVYVRSPLNSPTTYWFVGKVIADPSIDIQMATRAQKRLILDYARHELRPQNFAGKYQAALELWLAPGDSEMDVVQNKVSLEKVENPKDEGETVPMNLVGYNPEVYVGDERAQGGLRVERDEEGRPTKPVFEVNESV